MKKILSILLVFTMLFALCACKNETVDESSQIESYPETPANDFQYTELKDGSGLSVEYYYGGDEVVVIPAVIEGKQVKDVRISSFRYNEKLKTLYIPEGVTTLSVWLIDDQAATTTVEKIVLPSTLKTIDGSAFKGFAHLREINLPDSLEKVGGSIFEGCVSLTSTYLPAACFGKGYASLCGCFIENVVVPEGVTKLDYIEFSNAAVKNITLPSTLKEIGFAAFCNCPIEEITLPEGLEIIDERAFYGTKLKEVIIPASVKSLSDIAFNGVPTLEKLVFLGDAPQFHTDWENAFNEPDRFYEIHISKSAKGFSFPRWNGFPVRYTDSDEMPKTSAGFEYFENENGVTISGYSGNGGDIVIPESINGRAVTEIGIRAFGGNEIIKSVKFPATLEKIGDRAFMGCIGIEKLELENVREIGSAAFADCYALTEVIIPQGVETIGNDAFAFNDGIIKVVLPEGVKNWGAHVFQNCNSISDVTLPSDMTVLPDGMFFANYSLTQLTLPEGLVEIGKSALRSTKIESLTLPEGLKIIGDYAFEGTPKLKSINIPESLEYIGEEAFESTSITELTLPAGFKTFWGWSFNCCYKLEKIIFLGDAPEVKITSDEDDGYGYSIDYSFPNNTDFTVYINPEANGFEGGFWDECEIAIIGEVEEESEKTWE